MRHVTGDPIKPPAEPVTVVQASVDIAAPGSDIWSTLYDCTYGYKSGTSMATPFVAGLMALVRSKNAAWTHAQVENQVYASAVDLGSTGKDTSFGWGRINASLALGPTLPPVVDPGVGDDDIPGVAAPARMLVCERRLE
jgi:subtilisin family serine protease